MSLYPFTSDGNNSTQYFDYTTFDFSVFYNQFEIGENMCNFYAFKARDGQTYRLKVIATGQRHCPAMAQALASSIAERVKEQAPGILTFAYIDNFLLAGKARKLVDLATSVFLQICRDCNITVEVELPTCTRVTYLGVVYPSRI